MRRRLVAAVVGVVIVGGPRLAEAQGRRGFWFDFGVGVGSVGASADATDGDGGRTGGAVVSLDLGWALRPSLLAGFEIRVIPLDVTGDIVGYVDLYNVMAVVAYYPRDSSGFFVKGGLGGTFLDLNFDEQGTTLTANVAQGLGISGRVGYDLYLGRGFSVTPSGGIWYGRTDGWHFLGQTFFPNWRHNVVDATVSISFH